MNLLECLHDQSHVPSPHRLPHIFLSRMRVKYLVFKTKAFCSRKLTTEFWYIHWTTLRGELLDISPKQSWVCIRDELLDNSLRQFFGKYSIEIPFLGPLSQPDPFWRIRTESGLPCYHSITQNQIFAEVISKLGKPINIYI